MLHVHTNDMWYTMDCTDKLNIEQASMGLAHITEYRSAPYRVGMENHMFRIYSRGSHKPLAMSVLKEIEPFGSDS